MPHAEGAGVDLHYEERGDGPPVLVVHAMGSDALAWMPALGSLAAGGARAIAFDRRGYGASGAPEPYAATTVQEQAQDAGALLSVLEAAPALLVGDGFGALVVLELLVRRPELARGAVLVDPPLHAFVAEATRALAVERELLEETLRAGGPSAAVAAWLGDGADPALAERAAASHAGFFADYAGQSSWSPSRRELRAIAAPLVVVTGAGTPAHVVCAADAVAALVPGARRVGDGDVVAAALALP
ncbi:MAG TPA: alpha/beta hydrolase [Solirubrobacteraceae bacterium]|nr:alpha/beta hydrolase [Solirubrobacteraceae bacterium]